LNAATATAATTCLLLLFPCYKVYNSSSIVIILHRELSLAQ